MDKISGPFFPSRLDPNYQSELSLHLDYNALKASAIDIDGKKTIKIDIAGIAGTSLLKRERPNFIALLKKISALKKEGMNVRIRFLFTYIYSDFSYAQIEAERTRNRSTLTQKFDYNKINLYLLNHDDFFDSYTRTHQSDALLTIQSLYNDYCLSEGIQFDDVFDIRFSCLPLNFCILNINGTIFYDSYSYAKEKRDEGEMSHDMPLIFLDPKRSKEEVTIINVINNHFDYIWHHPTTLLYMDATKFQKVDSRGAIENLTVIKRPNEIFYEHKKERVRKKVPPTVSDIKINEWQFSTQWAFRQMTRTIPHKSDIPKTEKIFVTFSMVNGSEIVDKLELFLKDDFKGCIDFEKVDLSDATQNLYAELTEKMQHSTMALIFFTPDISVNILNESGVVEKKMHYAKPNVYFEYGYLMSLLEKTFGKEEMFRRLIAFRRSDTEIGSDWQDIFWHDLSDNILDVYGKILERVIKVAQTITMEVAKKALENYNKKLELYFMAPENSSNANTIKYFEKARKQLNSVFDKRFSEKN